MKKIAVILLFTFNILFCFSQNNKGYDLAYIDNLFYDINTEKGIYKFHKKLIEIGIKANLINENKYKKVNKIYDNFNKALIFVEIYHFDKNYLNYYDHVNIKMYSENDEFKNYNINYLIYIKTHPVVRLEYIIQKEVERILKNKKELILVNFIDSNIDKYDNYYNLNYKFNLLWK